MDSNTGGSGGFYEGMKVSSSSEVDWLWIMDDDTIPTSDCLEQLLAADDFIDDDNTSFYASAVFGSAGEFMNVPNIDTSESANGYPHFYKYLGEGIINIADATFVSLLIRKDAVLRCGLPCKDYFIWGDDGEYTLRLTHFYGPAYMVGKSIAIHKRMGAKKLDLSNFQDENRIKPGSDQIHCSVYYAAQSRCKYISATRNLCLRSTKGYRLFYSTGHVLVSG